MPFYSWPFFLVTFVVAFLAPIGLIVAYRMIHVRRRLREIQKALFAKSEGDVANEPPKPAAHYVRLFRHKEMKGLSEPELRSEIASQFWHYHAWKHYIISLVLVAPLSFSALFIIWSYTAPLLYRDSGQTSLGIPMEFIFALAGAYVWSFYEIASRIERGELTPDDLYFVAVRYAISIPIGHVTALLTPDVVDIGIAFGISAFPLRDFVRWWRKRLLDKMKVEQPTTGPSFDGHLQYTVDGLSSDTLARLEELQIVTYTDLAYADPVRVMAKSGFSLRHILQWIDHALLSVYAPTLRRGLRANGIPCSLDAKEFYDAHFAKFDRVNSKYVARNYAACSAVTDLTDKVALTVAVKDLTDRSSVTAADAAFLSKVGPTKSQLSEIFLRISIDPHVLFLETFWYTGYLGKRPEPPSCPTCV